jgi:hypothetical protein
VSLHAAALRELGGAHVTLKGFQLQMADHVWLQLGGEAEPPPADVAVVAGRLARRLTAQKEEYHFLS